MNKERKRERKNDRKKERKGMAMTRKEIIRNGIRT